MAQLLGDDDASVVKMLSNYLSVFHGNEERINNQRALLTTEAKDNYECLNNKQINGRHYGRA